MPHEPGSPAVPDVYSGPQEYSFCVCWSLTLQSGIFPKFLLGILSQYCEEHSQKETSQGPEGLETLRLSQQVERV